MAYDDRKFRDSLTEFLSQGETNCSRNEARQKSRFDLQYSQEQGSGERMEILRSAFGTLEGKKILEVGCGSGGLTVALAQTGAQAAGVEPDPLGYEVCELRKERYPGLKAEFKQGSGEDIPYPDQSFDIAFMFSVIEHVRDPEKVVKEMYRVLKPGGKVFIDAPNYLWPIEQHYRIFYPPMLPKVLGKIYLRMRNKNPKELGNINFVTPGRISSWLIKAGFSSVTETYQNTLYLKLANPETIGHSRKIGNLLSTYPALKKLFKIMINSGIYPLIRFTATK